MLVVTQQHFKHLNVHIFDSPQNLHLIKISNREVNSVNILMRNFVSPDSGAEFGPFQLHIIRSHNMILNLANDKKFLVNLFIIPT